jgi:hypothetical protein
MSDQQHFTTIDGAVDYYKGQRFIDIGLVNGTRTLRRGDDPSSAAYVAIWQDKPAHVIGERY